MKFGILLATVCLFTAHHAMAKEGPCKPIMKACHDAGYTKGGHKEGTKGLMVDCMKPVLEGKAVAGVNVSAEQVSACKEKAEERKAKRKERREERKETRMHNDTKSKQPN